MSDDRFAHIVRLLLPLFGATTEAEDQVESGLLLYITGDREVTKSEGASSCVGLTNQREYDHPPTASQRRSISVGREEFWSKG